MQGFLPGNGSFAFHEVDGECYDERGEYDATDYAACDRAGRRVMQGLGGRSVVVGRGGGR